MLRSNVAVLAVICLVLPGWAHAQNGSEDLNGNARDLVMETRDLTVEIRDLVLSVQDMESRVSDMSGNVQDMVSESGGDMAMRETEDGIVLSITSDVLFEFDSAELTEPARETLAQIAAMLVANPGDSVQVVGHTDSKGSVDYNQRLSEMRAEAVVDFLRQSDVSDDRLEAMGRGEEEPVAPNQIDGADNPEGRAQNRRVEFVLPNE